MKPTRSQSALRYPLNSIFSSERYVRVLRVLFRHGGALGTTRIAKDAGLSRYGTRGALGALVQIGIVEAMGSGNSITYRADMRHPMAAAIAQLYDVEAEQSEAIIDAVKQAVDTPDIVGAWLYGSFARGEDRIDSDLDIAVATADNGREAVDRVRQRLHDAGDRLHFSPAVVAFDSVDAARLSAGDPWWSNLVREAIIIKGGRPEVLAQHLEVGSRG